MHRLGQTSSGWAKTIQLMDKRSDTISPNLFDFTDSKNICYQNLYNGFEQYCDTFDEPLHLCGLSLGAILALNYTAIHPEKISSLVLIGAQYKMPKNLLKFQNLIFSIMPNSYFEKLGFNKKDFIGLSKSMMDLNFQPHLAQIHCKTLILCGDKDRANKSAALSLHNQIENSSFYIIPNSGHEVNTDSPAALAEQLNSFYMG